MRAVVGDILGKTRVIDIWNNETDYRVGGNQNGEPDRNAEIGAITIFPNQEICCLHNNGTVSFINNENKERTSYIDLNLNFEIPTKAYSLSSTPNYHVGLFESKCVTFHGTSKIQEFDTVKNSSCGTISGNDIILGRQNDRTIIFDLQTGKQKWIAADPPLDELKLPLKDDDLCLLSIEESIFIVGQTEGGCLLYDIRSGPIPIIRSQIFDNRAPMCLELLDTNQFIAGSNIGGLHVSDIRMISEENEVATIVGTRGFIGATAAIIQIVKHPSSPLFAALSMDRVIRLYDFSKELKRPVKMSFVKTLSNTFQLFDDEMPQEPDPTEELWASLEETTDNIWENYTPCPQSKLSIKKGPIVAKEKKDTE